MNHVIRPRLAATLVLLLLVLAGCDAITDVDPSEVNKTSTTGRALPEAGPTVVPLAAPTATFGAGADTASTAADRAAIMDALRDLQAATGETYVLFTSVKKQHKKGYKYFYKTTKPPKKMLDEAEGRVILYTYRLDSDTPGQPYRLVGAMIPDSPRAIELMNKWVRKRAKKKDKDKKDGKAAAETNAAAYQPVSFGGPPMRQALGTDENCSYSEAIIFVPECDCYGYEGVEVCAVGGGFEPDPGWMYGDPDGGDACDPFYGCGSEGGGSSSGGGSDSEQPCDPSEISCASYEPADIVSKAEVDDLIRNTCSGQSLPTDLGEYFQSSVRRSLNAANPGTSGDYRYGPHPRLTNKVDGYAENLLDGQTGQVIPGYVTSILEVKYTENPSNSIGTGQYQAHINDLASIYSSAPDGSELTGRPLYLIVTNSKYNNIEYFGNAKYTIEMPAYAASRGVNVMHLRVEKEGSRYLLNGDMIGSPVDFKSWLWDVLNDTSVPFTVSCTPED